jgi:Ni,Fe-hydrogenase maturation factor
MIAGRIICVGSRLVNADQVGIKVWHELHGRTLTPGVELVWGGLGGLDLLSCFLHCRTVVLVDRVAGFTSDNEVVVLCLAQILEALEEGYSHCGALQYLLRSLPFLGLEPLPAVSLVGVEGEGDQDSIRRAAQAALRVFDENP